MPPSVSSSSTREDEKTHFKGKRVESGRPDFYGLEEIRFSDISNGEKIVHTENREKDYQFNKSILWIFLFIVPVAGLLILAYTQKDLLFGKKSFENVSVQTKTHRIAKDTIKIMVHETAEMKIADSLKKDSVMKSAGKPVGVQSPKNNTKKTWQK
jgi:hypothetical protein